MAKEVTCEVLKVYCDTDETDTDTVRLCEVKWNGRACKGVDIRKYNKEDDKLYKGITISYNGLNDIIKACIKNNLCNIDDIKKCIDDVEKKLFNEDDFDKMFKTLSEETKKYKRNSKGLLVDDYNHIIINRK